MNTIKNLMAALTALTGEDKFKRNYAALAALSKDEMFSLYHHLCHFDFKLPPLTAFIPVFAKFVPKPKEDTSGSFLFKNERASSFTVEHTDVLIHYCIAELTFNQIEEKKQEIRDILEDRANRIDRNTRSYLRNPCEFIAPPSAEDDPIKKFMSNAACNPDSDDYILYLAMLHLQVMNPEYAKILVNLKTSVEFRLTNMTQLRKIFLAENHYINPTLGVDTIKEIIRVNPHLKKINVFRIEGEVLDLRGVDTTGLNIGCNYGTFKKVITDADKPLGSVIVAEDDVHIDFSEAAFEEFDDRDCSRIPSGEHAAALRRLTVYNPSKLPDLPNLVKLTVEGGKGIPGNCTNLNVNLDSLEVLTLEKSSLWVDMSTLKLPKLRELHVSSATPLKMEDFVKRHPDVKIFADSDWHYNTFLDDKLVTSVRYKYLLKYFPNAELVEREQPEYEPRVAQASIGYAIHANEGEIAYKAGLKGNYKYSCKFEKDYFRQFLRGLADADKADE